MDHDYMRDDDYWLRYDDYTESEMVREDLSAITPKLGALTRLTELRMRGLKYVQLTPESFATLPLKVGCVCCCCRCFLCV